MRGAPKVGLLSVDLHCHILPGVDDGPRTLADSEALAQRLLAVGIHEVVASSHITPGRYENDRAGLLERLTITQAHFQRAGVPLRLWPGAEVRLDDESLDPDRWCTLGDGGRYLLVELPPGVPLIAGVEDRFDALLRRGITPILAHPERHGPLQREPEVLMRWVERGVLTQGTLCVLAGAASERTIRALETWIAGGWIHLMASDAHGPDRRLVDLDKASQRLVELAGPANATLMLKLNPGALLAGHPARRPGPAPVIDAEHLARRYTAYLAAAPTPPEEEKT